MRTARIFVPEDAILGRAKPERFVTAFVDVLGWGEKLLSAYSDGRTPTDHDSDPLRQLHSVRLMLENRLIDLAPASFIMTALFGRARTIDDVLCAHTMSRSNGARCSITSFGDSLVLTSPITQGRPRGYCPNIIPCLVARVGAMMAFAMAMGIPMRAGIDIGWGIRYKDIRGRGEIIATSVAKAYYLESRVADYPRVVLGPELVSAVLDYSPRGPRREDARMKAAFAEVIKSRNGAAEVDYLHPLFIRQAQFRLWGGSLADDGRRFALKSLRAAKRLGNPVLIRRYRTVVDYYRESIKKHRYNTEEHKSSVESLREVVRGRWKRRGLRRSTPRMLNDERWGPWLV